MSKKFDLKALRNTVQGLTRRGIEPNAQTLGTILAVSEALGTPVTAVQEGKAVIAQNQATASSARQKAGKTRQNTDKRISEERTATGYEVLRLEGQIARAESRGARRVRDARASGQRAIDDLNATVSRADHQARQIEVLLRVLQG